MFKKTRNHVAVKPSWLEHKIQFIFENRTEMYSMYIDRESQKKIEFDAKKLAELVALRLSRLVGQGGVSCVE